MGKLLNGRHLSADRHLSSLHRCSNAVSPAFSRQKSQHAKSSAASEGTVEKEQDRGDHRKSYSPKQTSSWSVKDKGATKEDKNDYLSELGKANYNINVHHGQNVQNLDYVFTGDFLGKTSDIGDGSLRGWEFRKFDHLVGDYFVAPAFIEAVTMHIVKNFLMDHGGFDTSIRVPLILGIWGAKGQGKSFQCELAFKKLGIEPVIMSAGELEHEWAGTPGKLIRERYRKAADMARARGRLSCLLINDIDAGIGHFGNTQLTVNNQMVCSTLMNIADHPNTVQVYEGWRDNDWIHRVPIIVTGNDLSKLFAPLIRDGRMSKFYWQPTRADLIGIIHQMFKDDGLTEAETSVLLDTFGKQPLDFYGALRSSLYDGQILSWIRNDVVNKDLTHEDANMAELSRRLLNREGLPLFQPTKATLEELLQLGHRLAQEQEHVKRHKLSHEYMKNTGKAGKSLIGLQG